MAVNEVCSHCGAEVPFILRVSPPLRTMPCSHPLEHQIYAGLLPRATVTCGWCNEVRPYEPPDG